MITCAVASWARRFSWICAAIGLLSLWLAACATPAPPAPTPEPVRIRFAYPADQEDYYDELIEAFNESHPYIEVERRTMRTLETWRHLFEQGEVDALVFSGSDLVFAELVEEDALLDLGPLLDVDPIDLDDAYPSILDPFTWGGSVWAIPHNVNLAVLYYNKDVFDQYGASYPEFEWTWDDLLQAATRIRDLDHDVYGLVADPYFSIPLIYQHGGRIVNDWSVPTQLMLDDPLTIDAIEWFADLSLKYDVMPSPKTARETFGQNGGAGYIFWRRRAGMYMGWFGDRGGESWGSGADWQMEWGMVPLPRDAQAATLGLVSAHAITAQTEHPDACWEWVAYLTGEMPPYGMPAFRSLAESDAYQKRVGDLAYEVALESIDAALIIAQTDPEIQFDMEAYMAALVEVLDGDLGAAEAMSRVASEAQPE